MSADNEAPDWLPEEFAEWKQRKTEEAIKMYQDRTRCSYSDALKSLNRFIGLIPVPTPDHLYAVICGSGKICWVESGELRDPGYTAIYTEEKNAQQQLAWLNAQSQGYQKCAVSPHKIVVYTKTS